MNKSIFMGRFAADPELRTVQSANGDVYVTYFTLAVSRPYNKNLEEQQVDWIDFVAWRSTAEFICKYFHKGNRILVEAEARTRMVENKDTGARTKAYNFQVNNVEFVDGKNQNNTKETDNNSFDSGTSNVSSDNNVSDFDVDSDDGLPF